MIIFQRFIDSGVMISELTLDLNSIEPRPDQLDRSKAEIRMLEKQNEELYHQIHNIRTNPGSIIALYEQKLKDKIRKLRQENQKIQNRIQVTNMPGYAEMTKKKVNVQPKTPPKINLQASNFDCEQFQRRDQFDSVDLSDKCEVSTCQNFNIQHKEEVNPLRSLEPMQRQELRDRTQMTAQLLNMLKKAEKIQRQIEQASNQNSNHPNEESKKVKEAKLSHIAEYKKKLVSLLKKLKLKEANTQRLIRSYREIYEETVKKLQQTTQLLSNVQAIDTDQNVDDLYAEVISLEEKLRYINEQIERLDEKQWLSEISEELIKAIKRLGIQPPQAKQKSQGQQIQFLRDRVDQLAQIIIEVALLNQHEDKNRIIMLKHYYEQEKENNKKIIKKLQVKEQLLSKKLIDIQMNN